LDQREIQAIPKGELGKNTKKTAYLLILEILSAAKIARQALVPTEGVSFDEYRILMCLNAASVKNGKANGKERPRNQEYLADELGLSASRISSLLASMDESRAASDAGRGNPRSRAWITRQEDITNNRQKIISLTEAGKSVLRTARRDYTHQISKALAALPLRDLIQMRTLLCRLNVALNPSHEPVFGASFRARWV
jgi:DNA-binding MarR family transcriptional regulator